MSVQFNGADLATLREAGISREEAQRQQEILSQEPTYRRLDRPCRIGSGILKIDSLRMEEMTRFHDEAAHSGRLMKWVPASGAATRMFRDLASWMNSEDSEVPQPIEEFFSNLDAFPFQEDLADFMNGSSRGKDLQDERSHYRASLRALLTKDGLNYLQLPKALVPFHRYQDQVRSAFAEHLVEAGSLVRDHQGLCRLHFTVGKIHLERFEAEREKLQESLWKQTSSEFHIEFSCQAPQTDTIALGEDGQPFRTAEGGLLLRPGGHGALLGNLSRAGGDIVIIKNIDNIQRQPSNEASPWLKAIVGLAVATHARVSRILGTLQEAADLQLDEALEYAHRDLGIETSFSDLGSSPEEKRKWLRLHLDRPLRICGVVPNEGHVGGGPFWVRQIDGSTTRQIVESAEVDGQSSEQAKILASSTHFNPVIMACAVRDFKGDAFPLDRFRDPNTCFVTEKAHQGRSLKALEHPGLWNGAMAAWNTLFVELPTYTFTPVKAVGDLLSPDHQPGLRRSA